MTEVCDDCRKVYAGPAYYTFPEEACRWTEDDGATEIPHACTGSLCPACAGPYLTPDDENDPRRPTA